MGEFSRRIHKLTADLDNDFDTLLRVARAAEAFMASGLAITTQFELEEALEALPEYLRGKE